MTDVDIHPRHELPCTPSQICRIHILTGSFSAAIIFLPGPPTETMKFFQAAIMIAILDGYANPAHATEDTAQSVHQANVAAAAARRSASATTATSHSRPVLNSIDINSTTNKGGEKASAQKAGVNRPVASKAPSLKRKRACVLPALLRDEMVRTVAMVCMDIVYKEGSMKVSQQERMLKDLYHGTSSGKSEICISILCLFD